MTAGGRTAVLLGTPIDDVTMDEAVDRIAAMIELGRTSGRIHQVATVNVDFVVNAVHDPAVLDIMRRSDLAIPDGMGIVWGARLTGVPLRERTAGVDLLPAIAARGAAEGWRICLFGGAPGVAEQATAIIRDRYPGADVHGLEAPIVGRDGSMANNGTLEALADLRADVIGVALGNPKQEHWIARHGAATGAPVLIGIGGTLDFLTGVTRRAPAWMQRAGLEWIHRALSEPRRLAGRYAKDVVVFGPALARQAWTGRRRSAAVVPQLDLDDGRLAEVRLGGPVPVTMLDRPALDGGDAGRTIAVDAAALDRVDNVTAAAIVGLGRRARRVGSTVEVRGLGPRPARDAARLGLDGLLTGAGGASGGPE